MEKGRHWCGARSSSVKELSLFSQTVEVRAQLEKPDNARLVGGANRCAGRPEMKKHEVWRPVHVWSESDDWDLKSAAVICRQLDCGPAVSVQLTLEISSAPLWVLSLSCLRSGPTLRECLETGGVTSLMKLEITCSGSKSVRLVNGNSLCSGRMEVKSNQSWSSVCKDDFDRQDAQVVCRELGCGAPSVLQGAFYGEMEAPMWSKEFQCEGSESVLTDCGSSGSARNSYVRLAGEPSRCAGRLEMEQHGDWQPVIDFYSPWNLKAAAVVCGQLGCGSAVSTEIREAPTDHSARRIIPRCYGSESALRECMLKMDSASTSYILEVICSGNTDITSASTRVSTSLRKPDNVRLVGGANNCTGKLEVKQHGDWRPVSVGGPDWNLRFADIACRQLDCGSAVSVGRRDYGGSRHDFNSLFFWVISPSCLQSGSTLLECVQTRPGPIFDSFHLEITCSGNLEVKTNQSWSSVCKDDFDHQDAQVVCRELGCGAPSVLQGALYGEGEAPVWSREFQCEGSESALLHCRSSGSARNSCSPGKASVGARLVGGASRCAGSLQMKQHEGWKPVANGEADWTLKAAAVVCGLLECGSALSVEMNDILPTGPVLLINPSCLQSGYTVRECFVTEHILNRPGSLTITCSGNSVRLVNGSSLCSGRVEVKSNQLWSSVCEHDFDHQDAQVVCRELGCGAPSVLQGALYGEGEALVWSKEFQCEGTESALLHCRSSGSARNSCSPGKAVGLTCSEPDNQIIRLVGGANHCAGRLQMKQHDDWRHVVIWSAEWTLKAAAVVCGLLDCGSAVSVARTRNYIGESSWAISLSSGSVLGRNSVAPVLAICIAVKNNSSLLFLHLSLSPESVRLVNGNSLCSGRVEVKSNQSWSSVCEDDFDHQDAQVVCRELGCGAPSVLQGALYGEGEAPVWSREFQCEGSESVLTDCGSSGSARNSCLPVGLTCSESVKLVNGSSLCSGRVELKSNQSWSSVCEDDFDHQDAQVVCRELGCGALSVLQGALYGEGKAPMWTKEFQCEGRESALLHCGSSGSARNSCSPGKAVGLTCSGRCFKRFISLSTLSPCTYTLLKRLAGEPSRCAGTLEMEQHGDWQPVIDFFSPWNLKAAAVVCGQLGCGSAVSTEIREAPTDHLARRIIPRCYGSESALRECMLKMDSASTSYILEVICSGNTDITSASTCVFTSLRSLRHLPLCLQIFYKAAHRPAPSGFFGSPPSSEVSVCLPFSDFDNFTDDQCARPLLPFFFFFFFLNVGFCFRAGVALVTPCPISCLHGVYVTFSARLSSLGTPAE
uniref:SRCR domain-containing protein n=1 Tax=Myripristis murdjan TaxID=586833 RepID=A0A667Z7V9_9TELE